MSVTPILSITELAAAQSQPEILVNKALRVLEAMAQISVISDSLTAPPGSPADGDTYIVAATATGAWAGKEKTIAIYVSGVWFFATPRDGFTAWVTSTLAYRRYDAGATAWVLGPLQTTEIAAPQSILSDLLTAPPGSPADGDAYIVAATATGVWTGKEKKIAIWLAGAWQFIIPRDGFTVWVVSAVAYKRWDAGGVAWVLGPLQTAEIFAPQSIISDALTAPPGSPADGDAYIVAATATGAWTGKEKKIAIWLAGAWQFITPRDGFLAWVTSAVLYKRWDAGTVAWVAGPT